MSDADSATTYITYDQPDLNIIDFKIWNEYFTSEQHSSIIGLLYHKPMTISEIHKHFNKLQVDTPKSENTIYRYIQELIQAKIVTIAGHQLTANSINSKLVYGMTAKLVLFENINQHYLDQERSSVTQVLGSILTSHYKKIPEHDKLRSFLYQIEIKQTEYREQIIVSMLSQNNNYHEITSLTGWELYKFYASLGILHWILSIDIEKTRTMLESIFVLDKINQPEIMEEPSTHKEGRTHFDNISYVPTNIQLIDKETKEKMGRRFEYAVLLKVLRGEPKTIKDIHAMFYPQWSKSYTTFSKLKEKLVKKGRLVTKEYPRPAKRSENTIYQYLQTLIGLGIIVECGNRIFPGQSTAQILYSRSSKVFYYTAFEESVWNFADNQKISRLLYQSTSITNGIPSMGESDFIATIKHFSTITEEYTKNFLLNLPHEISLEAITTFTLYENRVFNSLLGLVFAIQNPDSRKIITSVNNQISSI